jgi:hypothetical protein
VTISAAPLNGSGVGEQANSGTASTSVPITLTFTPLRGDRVVLCTNCVPATNRILQIDQPGVKWTLLVRSSTNATTDIWLGIAGEGASASLVLTTLVAANTVNVRTNFSRWQFTAQTAHATSSAVGTSTSASGGSVTAPMGRGALLISVIKPNGTITAGPSNSFTALTSGSGTTSYAYRVVTSTGSYSTAVTIGSSVVYDGVIACILDSEPDGTSSPVLSNPDVVLYRQRQKRRER